jgi:hypothetical protein
MRRPISSRTSTRWNRPSCRPKKGISGWPAGAHGRVPGSRIDPNKRGGFTEFFLYKTKFDFKNYLKKINSILKASKNIGVFDDNPRV